MKQVKINRLSDETSAQLQLLTIKDMMSLLCISRPKVYELMQNEGLPFMRMGRSLRFYAASVQRWLIEHEQVRG
ncbi:helix-turn-helix domain-containing protein [Ktedonosporobacter rubrisoli]|uniref:Helix-turn-helix domain-containing protein n=2 Tax=Ktedonosporobacter rubrisoli TaxID=2509675 RepID=A0A4P6JZJ4_KTERU|nr:helix-turn-helix domain-containing protein [Ktedonosporobacter rubrisoli]